MNQPMIEMLEETIRVQTFAKTSWCLDDLDDLDKCEGWSDEKKAEFFSTYENKIVDRMVETGWDVIDYYIGEMEMGG